MTNLHFKNCSEVFNPFIQKSKSLKIGLSAYKAYVDKQLLEFTKVIRSIFDGTQETLDENGHHPDDLILVSVNRGGANRLASAKLRDLYQLVIGVTSSVGIGFCRPGNNTISGSSYLTLDELNQYITDKMSCLQGQSVIFGAALKQDLNANFSTQDLLAEVSLRGFETSDYLQSLVAGVTNGMTWADILALIAGNIKEPQVDEDGYWYFDTEDFSNTNSLVLGLSSIANSVSSFFSSIKFSINKIGEFFKKLWKGITDLVTWILTMIAGDLFTDYLVKKDYTLEGLNIPIASVKCDIMSLAQNSYLNDFYIECQNAPDKMSLCQGMVYSADNAYDGQIYRVKYMPNIGDIIAKAPLDVKDNTTRVIPWSNGFMLIVRKAKELTIYYFLGDFRSANGFSRWSISGDGEIALSRDLIQYRDLKAVEFKTNSDFKTWFSSLVKPTQDGAGYTIVTDNDFIGNGVSGDTSTGYENYLDMSINLNAIDGPGSLVDQLDDYYFEDINSRFAAQLLVNALVYNNIFTCDSVRGGVYLTNGSGNDIIHSQTNFEQNNFLPYETNQMVTFKYHAQSDTERANEVVEFVKKLAITAVAVGTAVAAVKVNKAIKIKSYAAQLEANDAWRAVNAVNPEDRTAAIKVAYKVQRKANAWQRIGSLIGGKTINSAMTDALSSLSIPTINDSSSDLVYEAITGEPI